MTSLEERFKKLHSLPREERLEVTREIQRLRPDFATDFTPRWWWWRRCKVKVLVVTDGALNFGSGGFGLSEFLTAFNALETQSWVNYEVTLAHRSSIINSPNPVVVNHISNFKFDSSVNLSDFDQLWMFAISSSPGGGLSSAEVNAVEQFMDGGGGVFATGDHGFLGSQMCGGIARIKDMRYWQDLPTSGADNEVGMRTHRRNDTNQPETGSSVSTYFDNQSDATPQTIAVRTFGSGMPHALLSISPVLRPSRIIDIMPDHPHEGECKPETSFTANGTTVPTQIIATSFVRGGSTTHGGGIGAKDPTDPHCFPSIAVWDGWKANAGRIVVDSTWHHFVNINLNGAGSGPGIDMPGQEPGLSTSDWYVVCQYYMNIATWMSRRKFWWCWRRRLIFELLNESQLVEASLDNPFDHRERIPMEDLQSIGSLAEEILSARFNPVFAKSFLLDIVEEINPRFAAELDGWSPLSRRHTHNWINYEMLLYTAIGFGFLVLRQDSEFVDIQEASEESLQRIDRLFIEGINRGCELAIEDLESDFSRSVNAIKENRSKGPEPIDPAVVDLARLGIGQASTSTRELAKKYDATFRPGVLLEAVVPRSRLRRSGFGAGSIIVAVKEQSVENVEDLVEQLRRHDLRRGVDLAIYDEEGDRRNFLLVVE